MRVSSRCKPRRRPTCHTTPDQVHWPALLSLPGGALLYVQRELWVISNESMSRNMVQVVMACVRNFWSLKDR